MTTKWIGVDLDGTLAFDIVGEEYDPSIIGPPVPAMVAIVKEHLANGDHVRIFTARASTRDWHTVFDGTETEYRRHVERVIEAWCLEHLGVELEVTCEKDYLMKMLYDDRAKQVIRNEGSVIER